MNEKKPKFTREEAFEQLGYDNIRESVFDLFDVIGANYHPEKSDLIFEAENEEDSSVKEYWTPMLENIANWVTDYRKLNKGDRINISDIVVTGVKKGYIHGIFQIINGQNGQTQVSRQSLRHVMDIMTYLEDYYGARVWISSAGMHSDVYYYTVSFVIWNDHIEESKNKHIWGNLRPLYHG